MGTPAQNRAAYLKALGMYGDYLQGTGGAEDPKYLADLANEYNQGPATGATGGGSYVPGAEYDAAEADKDRAITMRSQDLQDKWQTASNELAKGNQQLQASETAAANARAAGDVAAAAAHDAASERIAEANNATSMAIAQLQHEIDVGQLEVNQAAQRLAEKEAEIKLAANPADVVAWELWKRGEPLSPAGGVPVAGQAGAGTAGTTPTAGQGPTTPSGTAGAPGPAAMGTPGAPQAQAFAKPGTMGESPLNRMQEEYAGAGQTGDYGGVRDLTQQFFKSGLNPKPGRAIQGMAGGGQLGYPMDTARSFMRPRQRESGRNEEPRRAVVGEPGRYGQARPEMLTVGPNRVDVTPMTRPMGGPRPYPSTPFRPGGFVGPGGEAPPPAGVLDISDLSQQFTSTPMPKYQSDLYSRAVNKVQMMATGGGLDYPDPQPTPDEYYQTMMGGITGTTSPLYNPRVSGQGQFGTYIPSPGAIGRKKFKNMDPASIDVLSGFLEGGIEMEPGRRVSIDPRDYFSQMQRSWIPGTAGAGQRSRYSY